MKQVPSTLSKLRMRELLSIADAMVPVARLCLQSGKGAGEMVLAAKLACIEVASKNAVLGNRLNHSHISAITGLTRREIKVLSSAARKDTGYATGQSKKQRIDRVLTGWMTDPEFQDRNGEPLVLSINSPTSSFRALVREYAGDVTPMSVLKELQRVGAAYRTSDDRVRLRRSHIRAKGFSSDVLTEIASHIADLGNTLVSNIGATEHHAYTGFQNVQGLSPDEAALFQSTFSERLASLLSGVSTWKRSQARLKNRNSQKGKSKPINIGIGVYLVRKEKSLQK
jgi:hypothetical protein